MNNLSLIQILYLLNDRPFSEKRFEGGGIEAIPNNVNQAKMFAYQILEKGLEKLSPEAGILLLLIEERMITARWNRKISSPRFQSMLKKLRKEIGWNDALLQSCLQELLETNYVRQHRKKTSSVYELIYDSESHRRTDYLLNRAGSTKVTYLPPHSKRF